MSDSGRRGRAFNYVAPTYQTAVQLSERRGRGFDSMFEIPNGSVKFFKARQGDNTIRILPPSWEGHKHYAYEIRLHRDIGADKQQYLCLNQESPKNKDFGRCPICAERVELAASVRTQADKEEVDKLRATTSGIIYLIDRVKQRESDEGPMIWQISTRTDNEILSQSLDKSNQMYLPIVHPVDGYDVEFIRSGEGLMTRYRGFRVARNKSPVSNDPDQMYKWMDYLDDYPIPEILNFYSEEHISKVFRGARRDDDGETREREEPVRDREAEREAANTSPPWEESRRPEREDPQPRPRNGGEDRPAEPARAAEAPSRARVESDQPRPAGGLMDRVRQRLTENGA